MSRRLPEADSPLGGNKNSLARIEQDVLGEKASTLGHAGRLVEKTLHGLSECAREDEDRPLRLRAAAEAVHAYFIQREACGLRRHQDAIAHYRIPGEVLAILGAR